MSITQKSTKVEIMEALAEAKKEQGILHTEVTSLNLKLEIMTDLVKEEATKKETLIKNMKTQIQKTTKQATQLDEFAIELVEANTIIDNTTRQLNDLEEELKKAIEKVNFLTIELTILKDRESSEKKKGFFMPMLKVASIVIVAIVVIISIMAINLGEKIAEEVAEEVDEAFPIFVMQYDNGIIGISHNPDGLTLTAENDNSGIVLDGVDEAIAKWALKAGYDGILLGKLTITHDGTNILVNNFDKFDSERVKLQSIVEKFNELGCSSILAMTNNPHNIVLPAIFKTVSNGTMEIYEGRRKVAGIIPVLWGKDKNVLHIVSDNITGFISSTGIFMNDGTYKDFVVFKVKEEENKKAEIKVEEDKTPEKIVDEDAWLEKAFERFDEYRKNVKIMME